jgi:hypothetical protein
MMLLVQNKIIIVEESDKMPRQLLLDIFNKMYRLDFKTIDPTLLGWFGKRPRLWTIGFHRQFICEIYSSLDLVLPIFQRDCLASWTGLLDWGNTQAFIRAELDAELEWARSRPASRMRGVPGNIADMRMEGRNMFHEVLSKAETEFMRQYVELNPEGCWMLNQDPGAGFTIMSRPNTCGIPSLHTILHNPALHMSGVHGRWASGSEMLAALGFPVSPALGNVRGNPVRACSFCPGPGGTLDDTAASRTRTRKVMAAGNSQKVAVNVFVKLFALLFCKRTDQTNLAQVFHNSSGGNGGSSSSSSSSNSSSNTTGW